VGSEPFKPDPASQEASVPRRQLHGPVASCQSGLQLIAGPRQHFGTAFLGTCMRARMHGIEAIAADRNVDVAVAETFLALSTPVNAPISSEVEDSYQEIADLFYELGEISEVPDIASLIDNELIESIAG